MTGVRIDKWLWAARFFKTRALAAKACEMGRIHSGEVAAKAAREVRLGDHLTVRNEAGEFLIEVRGPATVAQTLYRETDASKSSRAKLEAERKAMFAADTLAIGRPSKRDRRDINRFRGR
jgi:ribosome-associated heat shock protein Hsp15